MAKALSDRIADKRAALENLRKEIAALETKEATRLGKIAVAAGLAEIAIDEAALLAAFQEIAARFQKSGAAAPPPAAAQASAGAGRDDGEA